MNSVCYYLGFVIRLVNNNININIYICMYILLYICRNEECGCSYFYIFTDLVG